MTDAERDRAVVMPDHHPDLYDYEERCAIYEFDAGMTRAEAEARAGLEYAALLADIKQQEDDDER